MYRSFSQLREGWTKNLALLFPSPLRLAILRLTEFLLIVFGGVAAIAAGMRGHLRPALAAAVLATIVCGLFLSRIRKAHFSWQANALVAVRAAVVFVSFVPVVALIQEGKRELEGKNLRYGHKTPGDKRPRPSSRAQLGVEAESNE